MNSRNKGKRAENELAHVLQSYGYETKRMAQFAGGIESPDVSGLPGIHIECKRVENLNIHKAYEQAVRDSEGKAIPAVFHRRNREPWMVTMSLDDFMRIYQTWQREECSQKQ